MLSTSEAAPVGATAGEKCRGCRGTEAGFTLEDPVVENPVSSTVITVKSLVTEYRNEKMPQRIGKVSTHAMRHSYRSWMDAVGTSLAVQQKLMRHSDIRTTMNIYEDVVDG